MLLTSYHYPILTQAGFGGNARDEAGSGQGFCAAMLGIPRDKFKRAWCPLVWDSVSQVPVIAEDVQKTCFSHVFDLQ